MGQDEKGSEFGWVEEMKGQANSELAAMNREIKEAAGQESQNGVLFPIVHFEKTDRPSYAAEIGNKDGDLIFHFYPPQPDGVFVPTFQGILGDAFLAVFPHADKLCWDYVEELRSWVVKAMGYGDNPFVEDLANRLFQELDRRLA